LLLLVLFLLVLAALRSLALLLGGLVAVALDFALLFECLFQFVVLELKTSELLLGRNDVVVDQFKVLAKVNLLLSQGINFSVDFLDVLLSLVVLFEILVGLVQ
jgi:hypothetical protein